MSCNCNNNFDTTAFQASAVTPGCEPIQCPPAQCLCCDGITAPTFSNSAAHSIYANVQQVFDSKTVSGCSITQAIDLTATGCNIITEYTPCGGNGCCIDDPGIDENSCFTIRSFSATLPDAYPSAIPTAAEILINNVAFDGPVNTINRNKFSIPLEDLNPTALNDFCQSEGNGSKAAVVINSTGTTVRFIAEYILCGTVTTARGAFQFKTLIRNDDFATSEQTTNIFTNDTCIPFLNCQSTGLMTFDFCYDAQLIAPRLTADANGQLTLTGTLIIHPTNTIETLIDKRVILNAMEVSEPPVCNCERSCCNDSAQQTRTASRNCNCK